MREMAGDDHEGKDDEKRFASSQSGESEIPPTLQDKAAGENLYQRLSPSNDVLQA